MIRQHKHLLLICIGALMCLSLMATVITGCAGHRIQFNEGSNSSDIESSETMSDEILNSFDTEYSKIYPLDLAYKKAVTAAYSNVEREEIVHTYQAKWKKCMNTYYSLLIVKADETEKKLLEAIQAQWEGNMKNKVENEIKLLQHAYESGTIVPVLATEYEYSLYRHRAIELYIICQQWHIDCIVPSES